VKRRFGSHLSHSGRTSAGSPGEDSCVGNFPGQRGRDLAAEFIGVADRHVWVYPAFDLDAESPPGPPGAGVDDSGHRSGGCLGAADHRRIDAIGQAVHDVGGDFVADVADQRGNRQSGYRVAPGLAEGHRFKKLAAAARLPEIDLHDARHSYATAGRGAKIDWEALSHRIGHSDVAFTMHQYVQTDLEADRQVANTLAELIIGGSLVSMEVSAT